MTMLNDKDKIEKIRKTYIKQGAEVLGIETMPHLPNKPAYRVEFNLKGHHCSIECPIEIEDAKKFYHIEDMWNSDVYCEVHIDDRFWNGLDIPDYYGEDIEKCFKSLYGIIKDIMDAPDHYEKLSNMIYNTLNLVLANIPSESLGLLQLQKHPKFDELEKFARGILAIKKGGKPWQK